MIGLAYSSGIDTDVNAIYRNTTESVEYVIVTSLVAVGDLDGGGAGAGNGSGWGSVIRPRYV